MKKVPLQFVGMFTFFMLFSIINVYAGDVTVVSQERNVNIECDGGEMAEAFSAMKDAMRLDKNSMFLKEWGVDLFNVTRVEIITEESNESE